MTTSSRYRSPATGRPKIVPNIPTTLIPNGIDREYFKRDGEKRESFREEYGIDPDQRVVLSVGQQTPRKGIYDFFKLADQHPDMTWVWVGGFPYGTLSKDYAKIQMLKAHSHENVIFTGVIDDISRAYSGGDIFFMPSHAETFGLVIVEALSSGLPVIAGISSSSGDLRDSVLFFREIDEARDLLNDDATLQRCASRARSSTGNATSRL